MGICNRRLFRKQDFSVIPRRTRKVVPMTRLEKDQQFYWTEDQCFGGRLISFVNGKAIFEDSGCDGNTYTIREIDENKRVYIECGEQGTYAP